MQQSGAGAIPSSSGDGLISANGAYNYSLTDYVWYPNGGMSAFTNMLKSLKIPGPLASMVTGMSTTDMIKNTSKIIVYEFEPQVDYQYYQSLYTEVYTGFENYFKKSDAEKATINANLGKIFGETKLTELLAKQLNLSATSHNDIIFGLPNEIYKTLITGKWIGQFEIPYYGEHFLHAKGDEGWNRRSATDAFSLGGSGHTAQLLESLGVSNINIAIRPVFKFSNGGQGPSADALDIEFHLYNETIENFAKNFNFLRCLISGPFWVQSGILQRPSNLFNVVIPGRLNYYFCTLDLKVEYVGKTRQLGPAANQLHSMVPNDMRNTIATPQSLIPDGYKVSASFQSIVPNNYNTFAATVTGRNIVPSYEKPVKSQIQGFIEKVNENINTLL